MALTDDEVHKIAKTRVEFKQHLGAYLIINAMLIGIWFLTTRGSGGLSGFWPVWTLLFWGVGLAFHAANTYSGMQAKEEEKVRKKFNE